MIKLLALALGLVVVYLVVQRLTSGGERADPQSFLERELDALVLDVRTAGEYAAGHVAGAVHANVLAPDFRDRVDHYDRDRPVYTYCASGHRSGRAAKVLESMGFTDVRNAGGFGDLAQAGAEVAR